MRKAQELVAKPIAVVMLLALLGVTAHAGAIFIFTSRDSFQAFVGQPEYAFNFDNLPSGRTGLINVSPMHVSGDMLVESGAVQFLANPTTNARLNFSGLAINGWGGDVNPIGGAGQVEFLAGGLSTLVNIGGASFVGMVSDVPLRAFNINFTALETRQGPGIAQAPPVNFVVDNVILNAVPEPTTLVLFATGAGLIGWANRRRARRARSGEPPTDGELPDSR